MHANLSIIDGIYGILTDGDVEKNIKSLGLLSKEALDINGQTLVDVLKETIKQLEARIDQNNN